MSLGESRLRTETAALAVVTAAALINGMNQPAPPKGNGDSVMKKELRHIRNVQPKGTGSLRVCLSLFTTFFKIGAFTFGGASP